MVQKKKQETPVNVSHVHQRNAQ